MKVERLCSVSPQYVATDDVSTTGYVPFGAASNGTLFVTGVTGSATSVSWYAAMEPNGTPYELTSGGAGITTSVSAGSAYAIPAAALGAPFLLLLADADQIQFHVSVKG